MFNVLLPQSFTSLLSSAGAPVQGFDGRLSHGRGGSTPPNRTLCNRKTKNESALRPDYPPTLKMKSSIHTPRCLSGLWKAIQDSIVQPIRSAFSRRPTQTELDALPLLQIFVPRDIFFGPEPAALTNHAVRWLMLGFRLQVLPLQEDIPDGYIGIQRLMREGRLISQDYLRIQLGDDGRSRLLFQSLDSETHHLPESNPEALDR